MKVLILFNLTISPSACFVASNSSMTKKWLDQINCISSRQSSCLLIHIRKKNTCNHTQQKTFARSKSNKRISTLKQTAFRNFFSLCHVKLKKEIKKFQNKKLLAITNSKTKLKRRKKFLLLIFYR